MTDHPRHADPEPPGPDRDQLSSEEPPAPPPPSAASGHLGPRGRALLGWLVGHRRPVLWLALAVTLLAAFFGGKLYAHLRSGFEELLPDSAPSVRAARTIAPLLHSVTILSVVVEGSDGDALARFADDLAARLRKLPPSLVQSVEYRTDAQEAFIRRFGGFYLSHHDLDAIQKRLDERIAWEKRKANPLTSMLEEEEDLGPAPSLDLEDIAGRYAAVDTAMAQFRKGYFQTPDGKLLVLLVRPAESVTGRATNERILEAVKAEVKALDLSRYDPSARLGYSGEVATLVEEQDALEEDLISSTGVVLVLVLLVLWIYFRRWTAILSILGVLAVGCAITFGLAWFFIGYLNANTAFLGSIVVGNGINVSIILVARFLEERRAGRPFQLAIETAWSSTMAATFVAAFSAGLAYLSLAVTNFRGFSQFGVIGGIGMAVCWACSYLLLPPLLSVLDGRSKRPPGYGESGFVNIPWSQLGIRYPRPVRWASLALLALAMAGVATYSGTVIEYDLGKLRAAKSIESGSQYWGKRTDQVFKAYLTPIMVRAETPEDLRKVVSEIEKERAGLQPNDPLRELRTLEDAVPPDQESKIPKLKKLRETLTDSRLALLDPEARKKALALRPPADLRPVTLADLPETIRLPLVERDGTAGRIALAFPKKVGFMNPQESQELASLIRGSIERSGAKAQAVSQTLLFVDIAEAILRDGPISTAVAVAVVSLLVLLAMRRLRPTIQVLASLFLGVTWLVGIAAWARVRLNFLNFVVLPITFGIGVDYAVNVVQRWRLEGSGSLSRVLRETGGAVTLCSLTTMIGYGSLLVADNRALRNFGLMASLGELACTAAALVALPAWLLWRRPHHGPVQGHHGHHA